MALPAINSRYSRATAIWPGCPANLLNARIERRVAALQGINRHCSGDDSGGEQVLGAK